MSKLSLGTSYKGISTWQLSIWYLTTDSHTYTDTESKQDVKFSHTAHKSVSGTPTL